jgi:hypothetical protein
MPTALRTSGFPLARDVSYPGNAMSRPTPPPATKEQPFGYRFREPLRVTGEPMRNPVYDPKRQVTRVNGSLLPEMKGTTKTQTKFSFKFVNGKITVDVVLDRVPD